MADKKISQLTGATTPLAGTEVLPIVQSGSTVKVSAANVTAGRAVSALSYTSTVSIGTAPLTVTSTTEVANLRAANATSADTSNAVKSNATTGVLQIAGPDTATTRTMTVPNANFTAARTDAAQTFTGLQTLIAKTNSGVVTSAASGVAQTLFDPTTISIGLYHVMAYIPNVPSAAYAASAVVRCGGTDATITATNASLMTLTLSGNNVQATQSSGSVQNITYVYFLISAN